MSETLETMLIRIDASTAGMRRELRKLDQGVGTTERKVNKHLAGIDRAFQRAAKSALIFAGAYVTGRLAGSFNDTTKRVQALDAQLVSLTGSSKEAARQNQYLRETADRLGIEYFTLSESYAKFLALVNGGIVTEDQARQLLLGLTDAAKALGANNNQLGQSFYGLTQALTQGQVQAQELNQVIEPMPGLMQAMDRAAGLSAGGFRKLVKSGQVTSQHLRDVLIKALGEFEGAALRLADKNEAAESRLSNAWTELVSNLAPAAKVAAWSIDQVTESIKSLNEAIDEGKTNGFLEGLDKFGDSFWSYNLAPFKFVLDQIKDAQEELREISRRHYGDFTTIDPVSVGVPKRRKQISADILDVPNTGNSDIRPRSKPFDAAKEFMAGQEEVAKSARDALRQYEIDADRAAGRTAEAIIKSAEDQKAALAEIPGFTAEMVAQASGYIDEATSAALDDLNDKIEANQQAMESWLRSVSDGFADAILGANSFGDALKGLLLQLAKAELSNAIFGGLTGKSSGGSIVGGILKNVAGRESGGPVSAGTPYIVGEKRPEIFVPRTSGYINPGTGGGMTIYQTIAPQLAGNAVTPQDLQAMAAVTKQSTIAAIESRLSRPRH